MNCLKLSRKECLEELRYHYLTISILNLKNYKYRMFKYGEYYHYMDIDFYNKKDLFNKGVDGRPEYNDIENHKDITIVTYENIDDLLKECG